jgi:hypothetical protein
MTLSNLPEGSLKLLAPALAAWAMTAVVLLQLWRYSRAALRLRLHHFLAAPAGEQSHTVLVTDIPSIAAGRVSDRVPAKAASLARSASGAGAAALNAAGAEAEGGVAADGSSARGAQVPSPPDRWAEAAAALAAAAGAPAERADALVAGAFAEIFGPGEVVAARAARDASAVEPLLARHAAAAQALGDLVDDAVSKRRRGKPVGGKKVTVIGARLGAWGRAKYGVGVSKVDAYEHYPALLEHLKVWVFVFGGWVLGRFGGVVGLV